MYSKIQNSTVKVKGSLVETLPIYEVLEAPQEEE